ncbi:MAG: histidine phosphatase family protein [Deltaproteobacteria bacterium]|nr:MAG: histidine phosphatase family protein [Deltaproteobacteria bacterium]
MTAILESLQENVPPSPFALLIRHADRPPIENWEKAFDVLISEEGRERARELGRQLSSHGPVQLFHSPVQRCEETALAIAEGVGDVGGEAQMVESIYNLGGPYLLDMQRGLGRAKELGKKFIRSWFDGEFPTDIIMPRKDAAKLQVQALMQAYAKVKEGIAVLVSHDWNLLSVREEYMNVRHEDIGWMNFMDGFVFHQQGEEFVLYHRGYERRFASSDLF